MYVRLTTFILYAVALTSLPFSGFKFSQLEMSASLLSLSPTDQWLMWRAEILIAELLSSFKFELSDTPVFWNQAPVMYPSMGDPMSKPELRLKLKALKV